MTLLALGADLVKAPIKPAGSVGCESLVDAIDLIRQVHGLDELSHVIADLALRVAPATQGQNLAIQVR